MLVIIALALVVGAYVWLRQSWLYDQLNDYDKQYLEDNKNVCWHDDTMDYH